MAEKIVEGLINQHICLVQDAGFHDEKFRYQAREILKFHDVGRKELAEAISEAMVNELTYGNLGTLTMRDDKGRIVAKLYILPDGTLADDSWTTHGIGWGSKPDPLKKQ